MLTGTSWSRPFAPRAMPAGWKKTGRAPKPNTARRTIPPPDANRLRSAQSHGRRPGRQYAQNPRRVRDALRARGGAGAHARARDLRLPAAGPRLQVALRADDARAARGTARGGRRGAAARRLCRCKRRPRAAVPQRGGAAPAWATDPACLQVAAADLRRL